MFRNKDSFLIMILGYLGIAGIIFSLVIYGAQIEIFIQMGLLLVVVAIIVSFILRSEKRTNQNIKETVNDIISWNRDEIQYVQLISASQLPEDILLALSESREVFISLNISALKDSFFVKPIFLLSDKNNVRKRVRLLLPDPISSILPNQIHREGITPEILKNYRSIKEQEIEIHYIRQHLDNTIIITDYKIYIFVFSKSIKINEKIILITLPLSSELGKSYQESFYSAWYDSRSVAEETNADQESIES